MCNLNYNQCNVGCYYPRPIDTCRRQLFSLLNQGTLTILNPDITQNFLYGTAQAQTVGVGGVIVMQPIFSRGIAIKNNGDGSYFLGSGVYQIEFSANGTIPSASQIQLGIAIDGLVSENLRATTSGSFGMNADLTSNAMISIGQGGGLVNLLNIGSQGVDFNRASIMIRKI